MRTANVLPLHQDFSGVLSSLLLSLRGKGIPLYVYESVRTPQRQAELYARGRTTPGGIVTRARAWESFHQYGLAADFVFHVDGKWSWTEPRAGMWAEFHAEAREEGLEVLSFEKPHVQFPWSTGRLRLGDFPESGGANWRKWLAQQIGMWGTGPRVIEGLEHPGAPDDAELDDRPALDDATG